MSLGVATVLELPEVVVREAWSLPRGLHDLVVERGILVGVHTLHQSGRTLHPDAPGVADTGLARLPSLGRDEDNPVGGLGAVDGSGGSVLEYRDALDVAWVEHVERPRLESVDEDIGICVVQGTSASDTELTAVEPWGSVGGGDGEPGDEPLQTVAEVLYRAGLYLLEV